MDKKQMIDGIIERAKTIKDIDPERGAIIFSEVSDKGLEFIVGGSTNGVLFTLTHLISRIGKTHNIDPHELLTLIDGTIDVFEDSGAFEPDVSEVVNLDEEEE